MTCPLRVPDTMRSNAAPTTSEPYTRLTPFESGMVPSRMGPAGLIWYWRTVWPVNHTESPLAEMAVNKLLALALFTASARRPPQPTATPSGASASQVLC